MKAATSVHGLPTGGATELRLTALRSNMGAAFAGNASSFTTRALRKNARPVLRLPKPPSLSATSMSAPCAPTLR